MNIYEAKVLETTWWADLENPGFLHAQFGGVEIKIEFKELDRLAKKYDRKPKMLMGG